MIQQLIFARPKPGMSEQDFQDYWIDVHAVEYASKIPQIKQYIVDRRVDSAVDEPGGPLFSGVAEMWVESEADQLAAVQSPEYVNGAREDEPRWAAFWQTLALDTDAHVLRPGQEYVAGPTDRVKLMVLVKRRSGMDLEYFRRYSLDTHAPKLLGIPGLRRYVQNHTRDAAYAVAEAPLDCVHQLWFDDQEALAEALASPQFGVVRQDLRTFVEQRYIHSMVVQENWIIPPGTR
ncbi:EthD domain-containing protein [Saccharopolyspora sp. NPDC003752]